MDLDTNWCPVCDRLIPPARTVITLPSSSDVLPGTTPLTKSKTGTIKASTPNAPVVKRTRPALPHLNRSGTVKKAVASPETTPTSSQSTPRTRTIISQDPVPLYCSEACRLQDQQRTLSFSRAEKPVPSPVTPTFVSGSESESDRLRRSERTNTSSSSDSLSSLFSSDADAPYRAHLAPLSRPSVEQPLPQAQDWSHGNIMRARRLKEELDRSAEEARKARKANAAQQHVLGSQVHMQRQREKAEQDQALERERSILREAAASAAAAAVPRTKQYNTSAATTSPASSVPTRAEDLYMTAYPLAYPRTHSNLALTSNSRHRRSASSRSRDDSSSNSNTSGSNSNTHTSTSRRTQHSKTRSIPHTVPTPARSTSGLLTHVPLPISRSPPSTAITTTALVHATPVPTALPPKEQQQRELKTFVDWVPTYPLEGLKELAPGETRKRLFFCGAA